MYKLLFVGNEITAFIVKIFTFIVLWLSPISNYVHLVLILISIDLITGSYAAIKEGQIFSARKLRNTIEKFIFYAVAIIASYILQQIIDDGTELARTVALYIGAIESKSIYENISRISKRDFLYMIWTSIKKMIEDYIGKSNNERE
jgi:phage-related holin